MKKQETQATIHKNMEEIVSFCKRRGFIFQSAEIYGGLNGCWDYGPLGVELKNNIKSLWWKTYVHERDDIVGMDGSILTHKSVLAASGHINNFSDPMCSCLLTKKRLRADQIPAQSGIVFSYEGVTHPTTGQKVPAIFAILVKDDSSKSAKKATKSAQLFYTNLLQDRGEKNIQSSQLEPLFVEQKAVTESCTFNPENGSLLSPPKEFNLMFKTNLGATGNDNAYLRPETAQTIFSQYKNIFDTSRLKLPFGIAQIGKAFRNEINPRNFTFRSREFEQMEIEYFCHPDQGLALTEEWKENRLDFYQKIGLDSNKIHLLDVPANERAHYSKKTYDIEYDFPFGRQELEGVAYRTDYDLSKHQEHSGKNMEYFDQVTKERFIPHVVEPSAGCDRTCLAVLCEAYDREEITDDKGKVDQRTVLRFSPLIAPIQVAILPLLKNNEQIITKAQQVKQILQPYFRISYDETAAIGRRYRRQDEVGTPFCITIDFETLGEEQPELIDTVTIRHRDSMQQERVAISALLNWLQPYFS